MLTNNEKIVVAFGNSATKTLSYDYNTDMDLDLEMSISANPANRRNTFAFAGNVLTKSVSVVSSTVGLVDTEGFYIVADDNNSVFEIIL